MSDENKSTKLIGLDEIAAYMGLGEGVDKSKSPFLWGLQDIAAYLGEDEITTLDLIEKNGLPVAEVEGQLMSGKPEIDEWRWLTNFKIN